MEAADSLGAPVLPVLPALTVAAAATASGAVGEGAVGGASEVRLESRVAVAVGVAGAAALSVDCTMALLALSPVLPLGPLSLEAGGAASFCLTADSNPRIIAAQWKRRRARGRGELECQRGGGAVGRAVRVLGAAVQLVVWQWTGVSGDTAVLGRRAVSDRTQHVLADVRGRRGWDLDRDRDQESGQQTSS